MIENLELRVELAEDGRRLDLFVEARAPTTTRRLAREAIGAGRVTVNGAPAAKGLKVRSGDIVAVARLLESKDWKVQPDPFQPLEILEEDDELMALNKPAGMPVHPLRPEQTGTLANGLIARHPELAVLGDDPLFPALIHRLDTATSGLVLAAKTAAAYRALRLQFQQREVFKIYLALVLGHPPASGEIDGYLAHHKKSSGKMRVVSGAGPGALRAVTRFEKLQEVGAFALLRVTIRTGVTHQIRCQLAAQGHPVVGDRVYGGPSSPALPARHFLHAAELIFRQPATGAPRHLEAPLPRELAALLQHGV